MSEGPPLFRVPGKTARNERRKALAATINAGSIAVAAALILQPLATQRTPDAFTFLVSTVAFIVLQLAVHYILNRIED